MATKRKARKPAKKKPEPTTNHDDGFIEETIEIVGPTGWGEERAKQLGLGTPKTIGELAAAVEQAESHEREALRLTQERDETRRRSGRPFQRNDDCDHLHKLAVDASAYASAYRFVAESAEGFQTIRTYLDNAEVTAANIRKLSVEVARRIGMEWRDVWARMSIGEFVERLRAADSQDEDSDLVHVKPSTLRDLLLISQTTLRSRVDSGKYPVKIKGDKLWFVPQWFMDQCKATAAARSSPTRATN